MCAIVIALLIYASLTVFYRHRTSIASFGAGVLILIGQFEGFYPASIALQKIPTELLILILVLSLFSKVFEKTGILHFFGVKAASITQGKRYLIMGILLLSVYIFSLFANNLSVVLVFTFIYLRLGIALRLPILPLLVGTVIASNIGGCPLPWADTPAMIITLYTDFNIMDFLTYIFPPCVLFIFLLILYTVRKTSTFSRSLSAFDELINLESFKFLSKFERLNWKRSALPTILFLSFITGIGLAPFLDIPVSYVAIFFGALLLLIEGKNARELLDISGMMDTLVFISALFLVSGALETSRLLDMFAGHVQSLSTISVMAPVIGILLSGFMMSTFLSAGPAAATLLSLCRELSQLQGEIIYVALALGILAGSSMLPWSATGGPVMLNEATRYLKEEDINGEDKENIEKLFKVKSYIKFSIPFSLLILILSALWLYFLSLHI